jgi:hypothetical protein
VLAKLIRETNTYVTMSFRNVARRYITKHTLTAVDQETGTIVLIRDELECLAQPDFT